jgi:hypothetical protein
MPNYPRYSIDYSDITLSKRIIEVPYNSVYENPDYSIEMKVRPAAHVALFGKQ